MVPRWFLWCDASPPAGRENGRVLPEDGPSLTLDDALRCRIRVAGVLEPRWSDRLQGLRIATEAVGGRQTTELSGELIDQAALMGVLMGLYNLGLPLLSV